MSFLPVHTDLLEMDELVVGHIYPSLTEAEVDGECDGNCLHHTEKLQPQVSVAIVTAAWWAYAGRQYTAVIRRQAVRGLEPRKQLDKNGHQSPEDENVGAHHQPWAMVVLREAL